MWYIDIQFECHCHSTYLILKHCEWFTTITWVSTFRKMHILQLWFLQNVVVEVSVWFRLLYLLFKSDTVNVCVLTCMWVGLVTRYAENSSQDFSQLAVTCEQKRICKSFNSWVQIILTIRWRLNYSSLLPHLHHYLSLSGIFYYITGIWRKYFKEVITSPILRHYKYPLQQTFLHISLKSS